jgi:histone H3/H4
MTKEKISKQKESGSFFKTHHNLIIWTSSILLILMAILLFARLFFQIQVRQASTSKVIPPPPSPLSGRSQSFLDRLMLQAQIDANHAHQPTITLVDLKLAIRQINSTTKNQAFLVTHNPTTESQIAACFTPQGGLRLATRNGVNSEYGYVQISAPDYPVLSGSLPSTIDPFSCN